jgi:hypothetical protein
MLSAPSWYNELSMGPRLREDDVMNLCHPRRKSPFPAKIKPLA